jgi:hypothetical protein
MRQPFVRPKKITIGSWKYRIHYISGDKKKNPLEGRSWAVVDIGSRDIWVDKSLTPREVRFVLVHEVLHAVSDAIEGRNNKFRKEEYCRPFTCFLINALESSGLFPEYPGKVIEKAKDKCNPKAIGKIK